MAAQTVVTSRNISAGDYTSAAIAQNTNEYLTLAVKFTNVDQEVRIKVQQTIDDTEYGDIAFPGSKEMYIPILGTGTKFLNVVGLYCSKIKIMVVTGKATAGVINSLKIWNS